MTSSSSQPCANKGCKCQVEEGQTYCGPHCANAGAQVDPARETSCACGHASCSGERAAARVSTTI